MYYSDIIAMFAEIINLKIKNMLIYNTIYETGQKTKEIVLVIELTKHGTESIPEALRFFLVRLIFFDHLAGFFLISVQRCPHFV